MAIRSSQAFEARERGVREERKRIMRDLHDDVGARLLTLSHHCESRNESTLIHDALAALRDTIHRLDTSATILLNEALADWRSEIVERLENCGVRLVWHGLSQPSTVLLAPSQAVHLHHILQEAVTNGLKHAHATEIKIEAGLRNGRLILKIANDGVKNAVPEGGEGHGLANMHARAVELGGGVHHRICTADDIPRFELLVDVPVVG
jgi:signal transduction histidine kinase